MGTSEKGYQPIEEEIKRLESMMTPEEKKLSEQREKH